MFGQHGGVEDRVFFVGKGVVVGAHLVELAVHVVGRTGRRPLENHVFEKVAHSGHRVVLVASARVDEEAQGRRIGRVVALDNDFETVRQGLFQEFHCCPCVVPSPFGRRLG